jgi:hypothetical protein
VDDVEHSVTDDRSVRDQCLYSFAWLIFADLYHSVFGMSVFVVENQLIYALVTLFAAAILTFAYHNEYFALKSKYAWGFFAFFFFVIL